MNITVHIERLVLDSLPVSSHDAPLVRAAVEAELARLLSRGGIAASLRAGGDLHQIRAGSLSLHNDMRPVAIGSQIARAVHGSIGKTNEAASAVIAVPQSAGAIR
jgi:hypothetical protein